jgi:hypothetical protein
VYNISEMSPSEAEEFLQSATGRTCARLYRRTDGTIITRNCPKGLWLAKRRLTWALAAVLVLFFGGLTTALAKLRAAESEANGTSHQPGPLAEMRDRCRSIPIVGDIIERIDPSPVMGEIAGPVPAPSTRP